MKYLNKKILYIIPVLILFLGIALILTWGLAANNRNLLPTTEDLTQPYTKTDKTILDQTETTPFIWQDKMYYLVSQREIRGDLTGLRFYDFDTDLPVYKFADGYGLASAMVYNDKIYITASRADTRALYIITCDSISKCSDPREVLKQVNSDIYNSSITRNDNKFIIAYESISKKGDTTFNINFLQSEDLKTFTTIGATFGKDYTACPALRYLNGNYYIWYTTHESGKYNIRIAKSSDLNNWEYSDQIFMQPDSNEDINTSDFDTVTFKDTTYLFYAISNQETYSRTTYAIYNGDLENLVNQYF